MQLTAGQIMETRVITLSPDEPVAAAERLFFEEEIHGAPVISDDGRVIGMITSLDLLRAAADEHDELKTEEGTSSYLRELFEISGPLLADTQGEFAERVGARVVADVMSDGAISVSPDTPVSEVAATLRRNRTHRVLVTEKGVLRGIISTFDLVALLEAET